MSAAGSTTGACHPNKEHHQNALQQQSHKRELCARFMPRCPSPVLIKKAHPPPSKGEKKKKIPVSLFSVPPSRLRDLQHAREARVEDVDGLPPAGHEGRCHRPALQAFDGPRGPPARDKLLEPFPGGDPQGHRPQERRHEEGVVHHAAECGSNGGGGVWWWWEG